MVSVSVFQGSPDRDAVDGEVRARFSDLLLAAGYVYVCMHVLYVRAYMYICTQRHFLPPSLPLSLSRSTPPLQTLALSLPLSLFSPSRPPTLIQVGQDAAWDGSPKSLNPKP